jgi:hypothetical protein
VTARTEFGRFWSELFKKRPDLDPPGYKEAVQSIRQQEFDKINAPEETPSQFPVGTKVLARGEDGSWEGPYTVKSNLLPGGYVTIYSKQLKSRYNEKEENLRRHVT